MKNLNIIITIIIVVLVGIGGMFYTNQRDGAVASSAKLNMVIQKYKNNHSTI